MLLKFKKEEVENIRITPKDYILELEEAQQDQSVCQEVKAAVEQIQYFEKRETDIRYICYRAFQMDDSLTRTNLIIDGMARRFYDTVDQMIQCIKMPSGETVMCHTMHKLICDNDTVIADMKSLLTFLLRVEENGENRSLSEIVDVIRTMEEEYINQLTKL